MRNASVSQEPEVLQPVLFARVYSVSQELEALELVLFARTHSGSRKRHEFTVMPVWTYLVVILITVEWPAGLYHRGIVSCGPVLLLGPGFKHVLIPVVSSYPSR